MVTHSSHKHLALPQCDIQVKWLARFIPDSTHRKIIHAKFQHDNPITRVIFTLFTF